MPCHDCANCLHFFSLPPVNYPAILTYFTLWTSALLGKTCFQLLGHVAALCSWVTTCSNLCTQVQFLLQSNYPACVSNVTVTCNPHTRISSFSSFISFLYCSLLIAMIVLPLLSTSLYGCWSVRRSPFLIYTRTSCTRISSQSILLVSYLRLTLLELQP